jgi:hypothetical protein
MAESMRRFVRIDAHAADRIDHSACAGWRVRMAAMLMLAFLHACL